MSKKVHFIKIFSDSDLSQKRNPNYLKKKRFQVNKMISSNERISSNKKQNKVGHVFR